MEAHCYHCLICYWGCFTVVQLLPFAKKGAITVCLSYAGCYHKLF